MMSDQRKLLWDAFAGLWPPSRTRQMTLAEYTNLNTDDAFVYWLEKRTESLGSIWGGSAYKFGVFARRNLEGPTEGHGAGRAWDATHGWYQKFGATAAEAFAAVRERIIAVLDAIEAGNLEAIDDIDFSPVMKWKIAFLYQDRAKPLLFPAYKREMLLDAYRQVNPKARADTPYSLMYATLMDRHRALGDVLAIGEAVWGAWVNKAGKSTSSAWAVPLSLLDTDDAVALCALDEVTPADLPPDVNDRLTQAGVATGDELALLINDRVRALARVTEAAGGEFTWEQRPVDLPSKLVLVPIKPTRLDAAERAAIWDQVKPPPSPEKHRCWRIQPDSNGKAWPEWRDGSFIAIGWPKLGDISDVDEAAFEFQRAHIAEDDGAYTAKGAGQVWTFRNLKVGDRIVINQGWSKVFAIGTVTGAYRFVASASMPHQLPVQWDSLAAREINKQGWSNTLNEVSAADFAAIEGAPAIEVAEPLTATTVVAGPCRPQNLILFGPPGTGKTYATIDRALELVLGTSVVETMSRDTRVKQFREHQQRGQIEFVTFHQAYGYEEFVEGLRPQLGLDSTEVRYEMHAGAFKSIALRAAAEGLKASAAEVQSFDVLWDRLVAGVRADEGRIHEGQSGGTYTARVTGGSGIAFLPVDIDGDGNIVEKSKVTQAASRASMKLAWENREKLGPKPADLSSKKVVALFAKAHGTGGGHNYPSIWMAYRELWQLSLTTPHAGTTEDGVARVQQILDKKTAGLVDFTFSLASAQYVLIIDEINRGNIAKIMGELITLLEPDKRLGEKGELKLPLAYTPEHRFAVPPNLHVVGTMNTADRSIALIDVALRRRFRFEELLPDLDVLEQDLRDRVPDAAFCTLVVDMLRTINDRIRFLYDRDHQLGHAVFMGISSYGDLQAVMLERVIPMLQEYFYGAWDKICAILGCPYSDEGKPRRKDGSVAGGVYVAPMVKAALFAEVATLGFDHEDHEDRLDFTVNRAFASRGAPPKELVPFCVGLLGGSAEERATRVAALLAGKLVVGDAP